MINSFIYKSLLVNNINKKRYNRAMRYLFGDYHYDLQANFAAESIVPVEIKRFANGEKLVTITDTIMDENITIVQSFAGQVDERIIETVLLIDAADRAGARHINLVIPWMGYSLQDKVFRPGQPLSARVIADLIGSQRVNRVVLLDLHNPSIPGFFAMPTRILSAESLFIAHAQHYVTNPVIVAPDFGGLKRAHHFAAQLQAPLAMVDKHRNLHTGEVTVHSIEGHDIADQNCIIVDDSINTGSTLVEISQQLHERGAQQIIVYATHAMLADDAVERLEKSALDRIVITNSIDQSSRQLGAKFEIISVAELISQELNHFHA